MVGAVRFELTTSCTRNTRASQATLRPDKRAQLASRASCLQTILDFRPCLFVSPVALVCRVTGTILNALGILGGALAGLFWIRQMSAAQQQALKTIVGLVAMFVGVYLTWTNLEGGLPNVGRQLLIAVLALTLGRLTGRLLRIQKGLNRIGQYAKQKLSTATARQSHDFNDAFLTCTVLFCFAPLAVIGPILDGISAKWEPLGVKAVMDALGAMSFAAMLGRGVLLSALPVLAWQGTIALGARALMPFLHDHNLISSVNVIGGLLVFCVALIILELKRIELGDYLPSILFAPLLNYFWK